ncbi:MAG: amidohydrolase [Clostridia bacterium]|nr:amidohydrolase [Clostridia bacterium]
MIIDFHTHCFPDTLAPRAMESLKKTFATGGFTKVYTDGTAASAKEALSKNGIDRAVVCNIATNAHQEHKVNDFAIALKADPFFYPLGSVHPDSERVEEELSRLAEAGIKGIKLHPDYVRVPITDPRMDRILSALEARGMFCVMHAGYDPISPDRIHATPEMLRETIDRHPNLTLIAAHMGGFAQARGVLEHLVGTNIYFDTSLCSLRPDEREELIEILNRHGEDRLLFGTDTPWSDSKAEIEFLEGVGLSRERLERIYCKNAQRLIG